MATPSYGQFTPNWASGLRCAATTTAASFSYPAADGVNNLRIVNIGSVPVYARFTQAESTTAATTADYCLMPGIIEFITIATTIGRVSVITETGASTLLVIAGTGA